MPCLSARSCANHRPRPRCLAGRIQQGERANQPGPGTLTYWDLLGFDPLHRGAVWVRNVEVRGRSAKNFPEPQLSAPGSGQGADPSLVRKPQPGCCRFPNPGPQCWRFGTLCLSSPRTCFHPLRRGLFLYDQRPGRRRGWSPRSRSPAPR